MGVAIDGALGSLKGLPLWAIGRAGSLEWFQFGARKIVSTFLGDTKEVGEFALHLDCRWSLVENDGTILASDQSPSTVLDAVGTRSMVCCATTAGEVGDFQMQFIGGARLVVEPETEDCLEYWRLFRPGMAGPHFVVGSSGADPES